MLVFWWHGKGYQTIVIALLSLSAFGIAQSASRTFIPDRPWFWGLALVVAAIVNWHQGTKINERSLRKAKPGSILRRLFYKANHRFMSLPMETFSVVLASIGIAISISGTMQD
jgi:hypothetical protein